MAEEFTIDTEFVRDSLYAGIWTRLCCGMRGHGQGHRLDDYIDRYAERRGDSGSLITYLEQDAEHLAHALKQPKTVQRADLGATVEVDDVGRFMPVASEDSSADARAERALGHERDRQLWRLGDDSRSDECSYRGRDVRPDWGPAQWARPRTRTHNRVELLRIGWMLNPVLTHGITYLPRVLHRLCAPVDYLGQGLC